MSTETVRSVMQAESAELEKLAESIDSRAIKRFEGMIRDEDRCIFFTGCGTSAMAARKCVHTLQVIGRRAFYLNPSDAVHGGLGAIRDEDVVIVISKGGETKELSAFIPCLREKGATIVVVGEKEESSIGKMASLFIRVKIDREPDSFNMLATASTLAVISEASVVCVTRG